MKKMVAINSSDPYSGDTLKYWHCKVDGCKFKHSFVSTTMFHLHEAHGIQMNKIKFAKNASRLEVSR
jgi:hypothetical protein